MSMNNIDELKKVRYGRLDRIASPRNSKLNGAEDRKIRFETATYWQPLLRQQIQTNFDIN